MEGLESIFVFCICFGIVILCCVLIFDSVLRWINQTADRDKRLNILSWIALIVLLVVFSNYYVKNLQDKETKYEKTSEVTDNGQSYSGNNDIENNDGVLTLWNNMTYVFVDIVKIVIKLLLYIVVFVSAVIFMFIIIYCIYSGLLTIILKKDKTDNDGKDNNKASESFFDKIKQRSVIFVITLGILSMFLILPILVADEKNTGVIDAWKDGVTKISTFADSTGKGNELSSDNGNNKTNQDNNQSNSVATYILIYIIALGTGFAVVKLLYSVLGRIILNSEEGIIEKYSSPIALLSVGIAFLLKFKSGKIPGETGLDTIVELIKAFGMVIFVIAIVVLTLEIVRLLMDTQHKFIHKEANYLFISLVGKCSLLLAETIYFIYSATSGIIGNTEYMDMAQVETELKKHITNDIRQQMVWDDYERVFSGFDEKVTKK